MPDSYQLRIARADEVPAIVALLADDPLGAKRERFESPLPQCYLDAFDTIESDPNNELVVAIANDQVVGVLQLTLIPNLTYQGGWRGLVEGVRVASDHRSRGLGRSLLLWAIERARQHGCRLLQLTTDKARPEALRFYQSLGFTASHEGMKLQLGNAKPKG